MNKSDLTVEAAARTHTGLVRQRNEDSIYAGASLFAVADGLGGHVAGDIASTTVIKTLQHHDHQVDPADLAAVLGRAIREANDAVRHKIDADPELAGMGTTLVAMLWSQTTAVFANIGDSRAYHLRGHTRLVQITEDHTYGNLIADATGCRTCPRAFPGSSTAAPTADRPTSPPSETSSPATGTCCARTD